MSLRALLEIVVHLESFRNIDLFYQGLYYVKVSVYNKKNEEVRYILYIRHPYCSYTMLIPIVFSLQKSSKKNKGS